MAAAMWSERRKLCESSFLTAFSSSICEARKFLETSGSTEPGYISLMDWRRVRLARANLLPWALFKSNSRSPSKLSSCECIMLLSNMTLSIMRMRVYPATKSRNGTGKGSFSSSSCELFVRLKSPLSPFSKSSLYASTYSGIICIKAIAMNTPPAKAFATPSIFGLFLIALQRTGMIPAINASKKATKINVTFTSFAVSSII